MLLADLGAGVAGITNRVCGTTSIQTHLPLGTLNTTRRRCTIAVTLTELAEETSEPWCWGCATSVVTAAVFATLYVRCTRECWAFEVVGQAGVGVLLEEEMLVFAEHAAWAAAGGIAFGQTAVTFVESHTLVLCVATVLVALTGLTGLGRLCWLGIGQRTSLTRATTATPTFCILVTSRRVLGDGRFDPGDDCIDPKGDAGAIAVEQPALVVGAHVGVDRNQHGLALAQFERWTAGVAATDAFVFGEDFHPIGIDVGEREGQAELMGCCLWAGLCLGESIAQEEQCTASFGRGGQGLFVEWQRGHVSDRLLQEDQPHIVHDATSRAELVQGVVLCTLDVVEGAGKAALTVGTIDAELHATRLRLEVVDTVPGADHDIGTNQSRRAKGVTLQRERTDRRVTQVLGATHNGLCARSPRRGWHREKCGVWGTCPRPEEPDHTTPSKHLSN